MAAGEDKIPVPVMTSRQTVALTEAECWQLMRSVSLGRIVFTQHALPVIRPVNHLVDSKRRIIVRSHLKGQMDYLIAIKPQITGIRLVGWCR